MLFLCPTKHSIQHHIYYHIHQLHHRHHNDGHGTKMLKMFDNTAEVPTVLAVATDLLDNSTSRD